MALMSISDPNEHLENHSDILLRIAMAPTPNQAMEPSRSRSPPRLHRSVTSSDFSHSVAAGGLVLSLLYLLRTQCNGLQSHDLGYETTNKTVFATHSFSMSF